MFRKTKWVISQDLERKEEKWSWDDNTSKMPLIPSWEVKTSVVDKITWSAILNIYSQTLEINKYIFWIKVSWRYLDAPPKCKARVQILGVETACVVQAFIFRRMPTRLKIKKLHNWGLRTWSCMTQRLSYVAFDPNHKGTPRVVAQQRSCPQLIVVI